MENTISSFVCGKFLPENLEKMREHKLSDINASLRRWQMADIFDFVSSLQEIKKAQQSWAQSNINDRIAVLKYFAESIDANKEEIAKTESLFSGKSEQSFIKLELNPAIEFIYNQITQLDGISESNVLPVGIVAGILPRMTYFFEVVEMIAAAVVSGNALVLKASSQTPQLALICSLILKDAKLPNGLVNVYLSDRQNLGSVFLNHPSIKAIRFYGKYSNLSTPLELASKNQKNFQLAAGGKNIAVLIEDFGSSAAYDRFFNEVVAREGRGVGAIHKIFILDSFAENFWSQLQRFLIQRTGELGVYLNELDLQKYLNILKQIQEEHGKVINVDLIGERGNFVSPVFVKDLPNCSLFQQDNFDLPIFIVTSVKYSHEVVRWANNSYCPHFASIFGDEEKAMRLAAKIEYQSVDINQFAKERFSFGLKQSFFGDRDRSPLGSFWSLVKKMTVASKW